MWSVIQFKRTGDDPFSNLMTLMRPLAICLHGNDYVMQGYMFRMLDINERVFSAYKFIYDVSKIQSQMESMVGIIQSALSSPSLVS